MIMWPVERAETRSGLPLCPAQRRQTGRRIPVMVQISWLMGLDKISPERVGAANDGGKSRGQPVNIGRDRRPRPVPCGRGRRTCRARGAEDRPSSSGRAVSRRRRFMSRQQYGQDLLLKRLLQGLQGQGVDGARYLLGWLAPIRAQLTTAAQHPLQHRAATGMTPLQARSCRARIQATCPG